MLKVRERNIGWRIDYFITSNKVKDKIQEAKIYAEIMGSDHCPVSLEIVV
jgi:exodeoxyribonuclease-3